MGHGRVDSELLQLLHYNAVSSKACFGYSPLSSCKVSKLRFQQPLLSYHSTFFFQSCSKIFLATLASSSPIFKAGHTLEIERNDFFCWWTCWDTTRFGFFIFKRLWWTFMIFSAVENADSGWKGSHSTSHSILRIRTFMDSWKSSKCVKSFGPWNRFRSSEPWLPCS